MNRPNIFQYAKKELSQDAIVCWLLACLDSKLPQYRAIGLRFIRFLFQDDTLDSKDVRLADGPHPQYYRIDVYAAVSVRGLMYPIIVEDKTNTYLHDRQMQEYCKEVADWTSPKDPYFGDLKKKLGGVPKDWGEILYVYFKTGYPSGWQMKDFRGQAEETARDIKDKYDRDLRVREIYLDDMFAFMSEQIRQYPDTLLVDYSKTLADSAKRRDFVREHLFADAKGCEESLSDENGCNEMATILLMERVFGGSCQINYNYQKWASHDLLYITDFAGNKTWYDFRFAWCTLKRKNGAYAFQLQQWRSEKEISTARDEALKNKTEEAKQIQEICRKIVNTLAARYSQVVVKWGGPKEYPCKRSYDSQILMRVFITEKSEPINVCNYLKDFSVSFVSEVNEIFGERVYACQDDET